MILSKIYIHSYMIRHYIKEENIFVAFVCKLLVQMKYYNAVLKIVLKVMVNK